ncbi:Nramp family divalent metal transporter [Nocardioides caldifontis]|uniref:Nramp family divalent metal transporter n=1 Tax=Nocardioides caldifontis TaxID=2588938 RepID=UPI001EF15735|nr:Nramp family divalent metal transporter [Nocardioides caldifontis]
MRTSTQAFATDFSAGASYGYPLLWVILAANLMAMLIQALTAKLGAATSRDLATLCRERLPRPVVWGLWLQAEAAAVATDLAEVVGGAIALNLLFGVPLPIREALTAIVAYLNLAAQSRGYRAVRGDHCGLACCHWSWLRLHPRASGADAGSLATGMVPGFAGTDSTLLATGILGATVMPHVISVYSALTPGRYSHPESGGDLEAAPAAMIGVGKMIRRRLFRAQRLDVALAMG